MPRHAIDPIPVGEDPAGCWLSLLELVRDWPGASLLDERSDYLHAAFRTRVFGFVDDVEFELRSDAGVIAIRSCSRVGYWDLGANRRRLESLRRRLMALRSDPIHP